MIREYDIPMIFVEENGLRRHSESHPTRNRRSHRYTEHAVSPDDSTDYIQRDDNNLKVIYEGLSGEELPEHEE